MRKKLLSLALTLVMCLGLTVPAFATGVTGDAESTWVEFVEPIKLTLEDVAFSVDPIGVVTIQFVYEDGSAGATAIAYMFDQPASVSMKDGRDFMYGYGDAWENQVYGEGLYDGVYGLTEDEFFGIDNNSSGLWRFYLEEESAQYDSPYMVSKSYVDSLIAEGRHKVDIQPYTASQPASGPQVSDWAKEQVSRAAENGLVPDGLGNNYQVNITRAEFAAVSVKLYEAMSGQKAPAAGNSPFTDTSAPAVIQANALGIVGGMGDGTFAPDALVTREQAALMLSRVYTKLGGTIPEAAATTFADNDKVSGWARDAVAFMAGKGIVSGVGNNQFDPQGNASIEQALIIALRMFDQLK